MVATSRLSSPLWGNVHSVSPAVAQVRRADCAETVAAFARFITDGDLAKRALAIAALR